MSHIWTNRGRPVAYCGPIAARRDRVGTAYRENQHGSDTSGKITYAYNSLGFRGPEFRGGLAGRVYAFGESYAFGTGVAFDEAWPNHVATLIRTALGLLPEDVCQMNFAEGGASNEAIARMVITQCSAAPPDLVLINFAAPFRTELLAQQQVFHIGPWFREQTRDAILAMPDDHPDKSRYVEALERGDHYLKFATADTSQLAMLRDILLVQSFLQSRGMLGVAICEQWHDPTQHYLTHPALGPLVEQIDPGFLLPQADQRLDTAADGQHFGPKTHAAIAKNVFDHMQSRGMVEKVLATAMQRSQQPPPAPAAVHPTSHVDSTVRSFYEAMPFNQHESAEVAAQSIRAHSLAQTYPDLHALLRSGSVQRVLEVGCGGGWLANTIAHHYAAEVTAVDFCGSALARASDVAQRLGTTDRLRWCERDLFDYQQDEPADLVISIGVLHHTRDCEAAFHHVQQFVAPGGALYLGLYHEPGRQPFLELFRSILASSGEAAALARYRELDGVHAGDEVMLLSWFRDQVLHPHETQHTLRQLCGWLEAAGLELTSTSINRFAPFDDVEALFELEEPYREHSRRANVEQRRYFPGFFTAMARQARG